VLHILISFLFAGFIAPAQQDLRGAFEKARMLDEQNTNLAEAVRLYGDVAEKGKGQRALAARARYQQAVLLARMGKRPEALNAWRAVIAEFPEQGDLVRQARLRLNPGGPPPGEVIQRRVGDGDQYAGPSPDGRLLAYTDWTTGNLALRNLLTGETRPLTSKREPWSQSQAQAHGAKFSPDGRRIVYQWLNANSVPELRSIAADGSGDRLLVQTPDLWDCEPLAWSPDGSRILFHASAKDHKEWLGTVPSGGGAATRASKRDHRGFGPAVFDRDGRAIIATIYGDRSSADIVRIGESGAETPLADKPSDDFVIGWTPGGRLLFGSDLLGPVSIWSLQVQNGSPIGDPALVKQNAGMRWPLGITRNGSLFYLLSTGIMDVYTAVLNLAAGTVSVTPSPSSYSSAGANTFPSWSPDGSKLLFFSRRNPRQAAPVIFEPGTNIRHETFPDIDVHWRPQWDPDGVSIFAFGTDARGRRGHFRIQPETGQSSLVFPLEQTDSEYEGAWSSDGRYYFNRPTDWRKGIYRIDSRSGDKTVLYVPPPRVLIGKENLAPSPDGRLLAFHAVGPEPGVSSLMLMPMEGGEAKPLFSIKEPARFAFGAFTWTPDSRMLLASFGPEGSHEVWKIPVDRSAPSPTGLKMPLIAALRLNRDGKTVAFHSGQHDSEIWILENFLREGGAR